MSSKIKTFIILILVAGSLVSIYVFLMKPNSETAGLVSTVNNTNVQNITDSTNIPGSDFLSLLLNVKNIKLDDSLLKDSIFNNLHDSSIVLVQDGTEGRPNPFAPIGSDVNVIPVNLSNVVPVNVNSVDNLSNIIPTNTNTKTNTNKTLTP
ncbi:hypothetical protein K8Q94_02545 [Candidatus Nomurabacteria bacterium]|nr:hypothetical protein [Candidatus Nomurabacteria bacterium]